MATRKRNALNPKEYGTDKNHLAVWDYDPQLTRRFGSMTNEIREMLRPFLKSTIGAGHREYDIAFFTAKDVAKNPDWKQLNFADITARKAWDQNYGVRYCLGEYEGSLVWRGFISSEPHFVCYQPLDYRKKKQKLYQEERNRRLMADITPSDLPRTVEAREPDIKTETTTKQVLVEEDLGEEAL